MCYKSDLECFKIYCNILIPVLFTTVLCSSYIIRSLHKECILVTVVITIVKAILYKFRPIHCIKEAPSVYICNYICKPIV